MGDWCATCKHKGDCDDEADNVEWCGDYKLNAK